MRSHCDVFSSTNHVNNYIQSILKVNSVHKEKSCFFVTQFRVQNTRWPQWEVRETCGKKNDIKSLHKRSLKKMKKIY